MLKAATRVEKNQFQKLPHSIPFTQISNITFNSSFPARKPELGFRMLYHTLVGPLKAISKILHRALLSWMINFKLLWMF